GPGLAHPTWVTPPGTCPLVEGRVLSLQRACNALAIACYRIGPGRLVGRRPREASDESAVSRPGRLHRARRRESVLRGVRPRRADDPPAPDLVDHPLAPLE